MGHSDIQTEQRHQGNPAMQGVLEGVKVLDLSRYIAGPLCAQLLGDMGADVIKVEGIAGEDTRMNSPQYAGKSIYTALYNRNKRAIAVDLRSDEGRDIVRRLAEWADVLIENFRPGTLDKLGLDRDSLDRINPGLTVVSISGYGQTGPYRDRVLFDCIAQAETGLMWLNARDGEEPRMSKFTPADTLTALYAALGAVTSLLGRAKLGHGQAVDVSVFDSLYSAIGTPVPAYLTNDSLPPRNGNRDDFNAPASSFPSADGHVYLHAGTPSFWERFCVDVLDRNDLVQDPRFCDIPSRMRHRAESEDIVAEWTRTLSGAEIERRLSRVGIPCAAVADISTAARHEQAHARDMLIETKDADGDTVILLGNPVKLSRNPPNLRIPPPKIGQHTEEVLTTVVGLSADEVAEMRKRGVVGWGDPE